MTSSDANRSISSPGITMVPELSVAVSSTISDTPTHASNEVTTATITAGRPDDDSFTTIADDTHPPE